MALLVAAGFVELGLYSFPRHLLEQSGRPFYLILATAVLVALSLALLITHVMLRYPDKSPIQIFMEVLGRPLGTLVTIWAIFFHFTLAAICLRYFADVINTYFLPRTPVEATMILVVLAVLFINAQGFAGTVRLIVMVFGPTMLIVVAAYLATGFRGSEWLALIPVLEPIPVPQFLQAVGGIMYLFVGVESLGFLLPLVHKRKRPYFWAAMPVLSDGLVLLITLAVTLAVLGLEPVLLLQYPGITALRVLRLPGILVERLGGVIALAWTGLKIAYFAIRLTTISMATAQLFGLSLAHYRSFLVPSAIIVYFLARWPSNQEEVSWAMQWWIGPVGLATNGGLMLLVLLVGSLRGKRKGQAA